MNRFSEKLEGTGSIADGYKVVEVVSKASFVL